MIADLSGKILSRSVDTSDTGIGGGEQAQWSYLSADGGTLLVASRDMDTPGERALTIWSRGDPVPLANNPPGGPGQNTGNNPPPPPVAPTPGNDQFVARPGANIIDGGEGVDRVVYELNRADVNLIADRDGFVVQSKNGTFSNTLKNIERITLNDTSVALDLKGHAGITVKILGAVAGKSSLSNKEYVGIGLDLLDKGMNYSQLAALALDALGLNTHDQIVTALWTNVIGSAPTADEKAPFIKMLEDGFSRGDLARLAAETSENASNIGLIGITQTGIEYLL